MRRTVHKMYEIFGQLSNQTGHNEGRRERDGRNHFKHSTLQLCLFLHSACARGKNDCYDGKSLAALYVFLFKVVLDRRI